MNNTLGEVTKALPNVSVSGLKNSVNMQWSVIQRLCDDMLSTLGCSVLFFSCSRSEGWPHHGRTFSIYLCPLTFWLTFPRGILSTSWCRPSRPCVAFLACVRPALFLGLSLSPAFTAVSLRCYTPHYIALSLVVSALKSVCCDFSIFYTVMPRSPGLCLTWYGIPSYTPGYGGQYATEKKMLQGECLIEHVQARWEPDWGPGNDAHGAACRLPHPWIKSPLSSQIK